MQVQDGPDSVFSITKFNPQVYLDPRFISFSKILQHPKIPLLLAQCVRLSLIPPSVFENYYLLCRYHFKNYHLSKVCTINVQGGCVICCRSQIFKEIYANVSLKVPHFVLFYPFLFEKLGSPLSF